MTRKLVSKVRDLNIKGSGRVAHALAKMLIQKPKGALIVDTIYDFKLNVDPVKDNGVERSIYYFGTYEKGTLALIDKLLQRGDVFVDVGANIGLMSIFASKKVGQEGRVIAFEPNPKTKTLLERNVALNGSKNIHVEGFALSNEIKRGRIYDRWDINRGGASLIEPDAPTDSYPIDETTFSHYFDADEKIKLVKIDVEGYELNVVEGAQQYILNSSSPPSLIVEFSSNRTNTFGRETFPLFSFLSELNLYRFFKAVKGKERVSKLVEIKHKNSLPKHDNVFCFTDEQVNELSEEMVL